MPGPGPTGARPIEELTTTRELQIWNYRCKGWTQNRIAEHLNISQPAVSLALKRITERAVSELDEAVQQETLIQLGILRNIVMEAMDAWAESKKGRKTVGRSSTKTYGPKPADGTNPIEFGELVNTSQGLIENYGDNSFLSTARGAMADIRKLLKMETTLIQIDWRTYVPEGYSPDGIVEAFAELLAENVTPEVVDLADDAYDTDAP